MLAFIISEVAVSIAITCFVVFVIFKVIIAHEKKTAMPIFSEQFATAIEEIDSEKLGFVKYHGELWKAQSKMPVKKGQKVKIIAQEGLILLVEPVNK